MIDFKFRSGDIVRWKYSGDDEELSSYIGTVLHTDEVAETIRVNWSLDDDDHYINTYSLETYRDHVVLDSRPFRVGDYVVVVKEYCFSRIPMAGERSLVGKRGRLCAIDHGATYPYEIYLDNNEGYDHAYEVAFADSEEEKVESININLNEVETLKEKVASLTARVDALLAEAERYKALNATQRDRINTLISEKGDFAKMVGKALRAAVDSDEIDRVVGQNLADELGVTEHFDQDYIITLTITIPADAVKRFGCKKDDLNEGKIEEILNDNNTDIEFWIDEWDVKDDV